MGGQQLADGDDGGGKGQGDGMGGPKDDEEEMEDDGAWWLEDGSDDDGEKRVWEWIEEEWPFGWLEGSDGQVVQVAAVTAAAREGRRERVRMHNDVSSNDRTARSLPLHASAHTAVPLIVVLHVVVVVVVVDYEVALADLP